MFSIGDNVNPCLVNKAFNSLVSLAIFAKMVKLSDQ